MLSAVGRHKKGKEEGEDRNGDACLNGMVREGLAEEDGM